MILILVAFLVGTLFGLILTCAIVASDSDKEDALIYHAGWSDGYRAGLKGKEK